MDWHQDTYKEIEEGGITRLSLSLLCKIRLFIHPPKPSKNGGRNGGQKKDLQQNHCKSLKLLARPAGIEPTTKNLEVSLNILLTQYNFIKFTNFLVIYILTKNQFYFHLRPFRGAKLEQKLLLDLHY